MIVTEKAICQMCGEEYDNSYVYPRAPFAPYWCEKCEQEANEVCGGWIGAAYRASRNPWEEGE